MAERTYTALRELQRSAKRRERHQTAPPQAPPSHWRPQTRADCEGGARPCPFYGCRYHLGLDVTRAGSIKMPFGEELFAMHETCALDVAARGEQELLQLAQFLNYNKERARQLLLLAMDALGDQLARDENLTETPRKRLASFLASDAILDETEEPLGLSDGDEGLATKAEDQKGSAD